MTLARIFINFRNEDGDWAAQAIRETLTEQFGTGEVFLSSSSIPLAAHFEDELLHHARSCDVLLALIGPDWLTVAGTDGRPKLGAADDWVSREIAAALGARKKVIPVLLNGAVQPRASDLPSEIAVLAGLQSCRLDRRQYGGDIAELMRNLVALIPDLNRKPPELAGLRGADVSVKVGQADDEALVGGVEMPSESHLDGTFTVTVDRAGGRSKVLGVVKRDSPKALTELPDQRDNEPGHGGGGTGSPRR